jgi:Ca2+-binding EF-hand superfamily protein
MFVDRMFSLFDANKDTKINFQEFISGLSVFSEKGTMDEKLKCKNFNLFIKFHSKFMTKMVMLSFQEKSCTNFWLLL